MKVKHTFSVKWRMIGLMLLCWFLPFLLIAGVTGYYMLGNHFETMVRHETDQVTANNQISDERLNTVIDISRAATYDGTINYEYKKLTNGQVSHSAMLMLVNEYLYKTYSQEPSVQDVIFWLYDDPEAFQTRIKNESAGGSYSHAKEYWEEDHEKILEQLKKQDTAMKFFVSEDRLYLIRNMVDSRYQPFGALIMRVNQDYCFEYLTGVGEEQDVTVRIDNLELTLRGNPVKNEDVSTKERLSGSGYYWKNHRLGVYDVTENRFYRLTAMVKYEDGAVFTPIIGYRFILAGMLLLLLPLLLLTFRMFRRYVMCPVNCLMEGAREIEEGNLGYQTKEEALSREFQYLTDSFNRMSERLKYQFDHIYKEEIALRDAKIMALQSRINPHFMNNTLEIINWEARMAGAAKVSEMIGALSTLMDATMDRKKQPEVLLSEEMVYVNAYLRILKERMGKRLTVQNEIPEDIMEYKVPRLILQPIIENAVEHGAARRSRGTVLLSGRKEGDYLYLEIYNDGQLDKEELEKVERLLSPDYDTCKEPSGSLGIANVNQRLKILYGEPCGLVMENTSEGQIMVRLTILIKEENKKIQIITD